MSPKLKALSGNDVVSIMQQHGFTVLSQRGSHVKLRRVTEEGKNQTLTIPLHRDLDKGTVMAIIRQASRYISSDTLQRHFFTD